MNTHRCVLLQGVQDIKQAYSHLLQARTDQACQSSALIMVDGVVCAVPVGQGLIDIDRAEPVQARGTTVCHSSACPFIIL
ncbi:MULTISPECIES: hypothetical protein [Pseudomonas]|uniref:hypothetical protein n=1 Tax=Pseudomonas TaxID=286 RepID=UPI000761882D|nr:MULTISPECIES: hypothetical protein [Pseudomonas]OAS12290.1 hypothetical protein AYO08_05995 [Pseudomonas putida]